MTPGRTRRLLVVLAFELEAEQPVDERRGVAALEAVAAQRLVDAFVRAHHPLADRLDDDVGVTLEHAHEPLELLEQRRLGVRTAHRAEQRAGIAEAAERLHRLRVREVERRRAALRARPGRISYAPT